MRTITEKAVKAFLNTQKFKLSNTEVTQNKIKFNIKKISTTETTWTNNVF